MRRVALGSIKSATADKSFSIYIRTRDPLCKRCKRAPTRDCSHFWGRGHSATRYDPKNCVGLCRPCHDIWEHQKNVEYKDWMEDWLGLEEYIALERRARSFMKREKAIQQWQELCKTLSSEEKVNYT